MSAAKALGSRRPRGLGSLLVYSARDGTETWHGKFRDRDGRQVKHRIGTRRYADGTLGLSQLDAEARLARMMGKGPRTNGRPERDPLAAAYSDMRKAMQVLDRAVLTVRREQRPFVRDALEALYAAEDAVGRATRIA